MILTESQLAPAPMPLSSVRLRLTLLVMGHVLLCLLPMLRLLTPRGSWGNAYRWVIEAPAVGSLMTLALYLGLGHGRLLSRLLLAATGATAAMLLAALAKYMERSASGQYRIEWLMHDVAREALMAAVYVGVLGAGLLIVRFWFVITRPEIPDDAPSRSWLKFSVFHLLIAMSICGVATTLVKTARNVEENGGWAFLGSMVVIVSLLLANTFVATLATLGRRPLGPRIAVSLIVAAGLGLGLALTAGHDRLGWQSVLGAVAFMAIVTLVIVGSLLVVRSCGYRLIRRPKGACVEPTARE